MNYVKEIIYENNCYVLILDDLEIKLNKTIKQYDLHFSDDNFIILTQGNLSKEDLLAINLIKIESNMLCLLSYVSIIYQKKINNKKDFTENYKEWQKSNRFDSYKACNLNPELFYNIFDLIRENYSIEQNDLLLNFIKITLNKLKDNFTKLYITNYTSTKNIPMNKEYSKLKNIQKFVFSNI